MSFLAVKFLVFQSVIILPFLAGSVLNRKGDKISGSAKKIIAFNLILMEPPIILWSIWGLSLKREMMLLPLAGLIMVLVGLLSGKATSRLLQTDVKREKVYTICSSLSNHGFTLGGFLCYLFAGEQGLALSAIFIIYFIPYTFMMIFPYAGTNHLNEVFSWHFIKDFIFSYRNLPLYTVFVALFLNLAEISRPEIYFPIDPFLATSIALYYLTLGINFKLSDLSLFNSAHLLMALQKFIFLPLLTFLVLQFFPLSNEIRLVILLQSFMPIAVYAVISSILFDLDSGWASGLFVINTLIFILLVFPALFFFIPHLSSF